jgi:ribosomal protein L12E/L44/L45/RPP1/RPP2
MSEMFFVLKTLVVTVIVVMLMQIKVGRATLEEHSMRWIRNSDAVETLRYVAEGAVRIAESGAKTLSSSLAWKSGEEAVKTGESVVRSNASKYSWEIKRSAAYHKQQEQKKREAKERSDD